MYLNDFAVIEEIIRQTGEEGETFYFEAMHQEITGSLEQVFVTTEDAPKKTLEKDPKDGLRAILFLMLQVCIVSKGGNLEEDFGALWKTYHKIMKDQKSTGTSTYCSMVRNLLNLTVGFQNEQVSLCIL
jgi:hypothetical protein